MQSLHSTFASSGEGKSHVISTLFSKKLNGRKGPTAEPAPTGLAMTRGNRLEGVPEGSGQELFAF